jgi:hypothetical protein
MDNSSKLKELLSLSNILVCASVLWITYSVIVSTKGRCDYYTEEVSGEWFVKYTESADDETGNVYEITDYGPISEKEATKIVADCDTQADSWMNSYGSIYRYTKGDGFSSGLRLLLIMVGPLFAFWLIHKWHSS